MTRRIVIVGGGAAGWLTAAHLAQVLNRGRRDGPVAITLVEAPDVGLIGVGEGTFPTIRSTLAGLGVGEAAFMRACSASFKQGVWFDDWAEVGESYFHPFNLPFPSDAGDLSEAWLRRRAAGNDKAFADSVTVQQRVVEAGLGPKRPGDPDFGGPMNYAYHFDAVRFAGFLRDTAVIAGVTHLQGRVTAVSRDATGDIAAIRTDSHGELTGDFFIDCSGFQGLLQPPDAPWRSCRDVLLNDAALAIQLPYPTPDTPIAPFTRATAKAAGWIWDIGLESRRGLGYVFSTRHSDADRAETELRQHVGAEYDHLPVRRLTFETGYRERPWNDNCVAVGLAAGFFEPLESTGIMLIEVAARMIGEALPLYDRAAMAGAARNFNDVMRGRCQRILDFLKLHYCLSRRRDSDYWRDTTAPETLPESLADKLAQWRRRPLSRFDFIVDLETFLPPSWQYILYGMGFPVALGADLRTPSERRAADAVFARVGQASAEAVKHLPDHAALLRRHYSL